MATYELRFKSSVTKNLRGPPKPDIERILAMIELQAEPRPAGSDKLSGGEKYRIRQGDYCMLCSIDDEQIVVEVVKVGHRAGVYR